MAIHCFDLGFATFIQRGRAANPLSYRRQRHSLPMLGAYRRSELDGHVQLLPISYFPRIGSIRAPLQAPYALHLTSAGAEVARLAATERAVVRLPQAAGVELTRQQSTQLALHGGFRVSTRKMRQASSSPWLSMVDDGGTDRVDGWVTDWAQSRGLA